MDAQELVAPVALTIRESATEAEAVRQLPENLMRRLRQAGLFAIYTPKRFGGMGLSLPDALRVVEEVARHDGSTGWMVALGFANEALTCGLEDKVAGRLFEDGSALIAGGPGFAVRAQIVEGGYRLTGQWPFNSGSANCDWVSVAAPVFDGEEPRMGSGGPEMTSAFLQPSEVTIVDTWHVTGMRATSSQDLRVNDVFVPKEMTTPFGLPEGPASVRDSVLARLPFMTLLGVVQAPPTCLGIARHAIESFRELALAKERPFSPRLSDQAQAQVGMARAEGLLGSARTHWYHHVEKTWETAERGLTPCMEDRVQLRVASLIAAENCLAAVDILHRLAGTTAIFQPSELERCWRDVHTAAQHVQVQHGRWETAGRILFGLEPHDPFV